MSMVIVTLCGQISQAVQTSLEMVGEVQSQKSTNPSLLCVL